MFLTKDRYASIKSELLDLKQEIKKKNPLACILQADNE